MVELAVVGGETTETNAVVVRGSVFIGGEGAGQDCWPQAMVVQGDLVCWRWSLSLPVSVLQVRGMKFENVRSSK